MSATRVLIADDEPLARRGVSQLLEPHADFRVVGEARNGAEAARMVVALRPDVLFLDVEMPGNDGFAVLARSPEPPPLVVFLTAYEEYAVRAFEVDAVDYLVKPPSRARFDSALARVRAALAARRQAPADDAGPGVVVDTDAGRRLLRPEEIEWIEALDYYAAVHAAGGRFLVRASLDTLERELPSALFQRVHRSALVNLSCIELLETGRGGGALRLRSGARVPVSRRRRGALAAWLHGGGEERELGR